MSQSNTILNCIVRSQVPIGWNSIAIAFSKNIGTKMGLSTLFSIDAIEATIPIDKRNDELTILDIAGGFGPLSVYGSTRINEFINTKFISTDFSVDMINGLNSLIEKEKLKNITTHVCDGQNLSIIENDSIDYTFSIFGLVFFPSIEKGISEMYRVLKLNGKTCITGMTKQSFLNKVIQLSMDELLTEQNNGIPIKFIQTSLQLSDELYFRNVLELNGFKNISINTIQHVMELNEFDDLFKSLQFNPSYQDCLDQLKSKELQDKLQPTFIKHMKLINPPRSLENNKLQLISQAYIGVNLSSSIIVKDVSPSDSYFKYPEQSNLESCNFKFYVSAHDTANLPDSFVFTSSPQVSLSEELINVTSILYSFSMVMPIGEYTILVTVKKVADTNSDSVEIKYKCEKIDYQSPDFNIEVLPISELPIVGIQISNTFIKLTGLKYSIPLLAILVNGITTIIPASAPNMFIYLNTVKFDNKFGLPLEFNVLFPNGYKYPLLSIPPMMNKNSNNSVIVYTEFPDALTFSEPCIGCSPIYSIKTKITDYAPILSVKVGDSFLSSIPLERDSEFITYYGKISYYDSNIPLSVAVYYQNGATFKDTVQNSIKIVTKTPNNIEDLTIVTYLPRGTGSIQKSDMFTILLNNNPNSYDFFSYKFSVGESNIILGSPFGLVGNNDNFAYKASFLRQKTTDNVNNQDLYYGPIGYSKSKILDTTVVTLPALTTLTFFEVKALYGCYLFRIQLDSLDYFSGIKLGSKIYGYDSLIIDENGNSIFEIIDDFNYNSISIIDKFFRSKFYTPGSYYSISPALKIELQTRSVKQFSIKNVWFLNNEIDVTDKQVSNVMFISFNEFNLDDIPNIGLILLDPVSYDYDFNTFSPFYGKYNLDLQLFTIEFNVPANTLPGIQSFILLFGEDTTFSNINLPPSSQLHVKSQHFNARAPTITSIQVYETLIAPSYVYWVLEISSPINGFSHGEIIIRGSSDNSIYRFPFTKENVTSGNQNLGVYNFQVPIDDQMCYKQNYILEKVSLFNNIGKRSFFSISESNANIVQNPFINHLSSPFSSYGIYALENSACSSSLDINLPVLNSFSANPSKSPNGFSQTILFSFTVIDNSRGIKYDQLPIVYLTTEGFKTIQCVSRVDFVISFKEIQYNCEIELPYGFGYKSDIIYSVYGLMNNGGSYNGYSTEDLKNFNFDYFFDQEIELLKKLEITGTSKIGSNSGDLWLFGREFKSSQTIVLIKYDGEIEFSELNTPSNVYSSTLFVNGIKSTKLPFTIKVRTNNGSVIKDSNEYIVNPIIFDYATIVNPTNPPQLCLGNPICGGTNQGYCNNSTGCICYSPWIGKDCSSKVLIVPQPNTNTTNPTTESDTTLFKSLISIISIRELDFKSNKVSEYKFDKWIYNELNSTTNQYFTNISVINSDDGNNSGKTITPIKVTIQWFKESTNITFARELLLMNPSTIKYTIEIGSYKFKSNLNTLQLIVSATLNKNSNDNICSAKEFGETSNGDNSNYIKLQVDDHSLYGRFIKRAIVDGNIKTINNIPLDDSFESIENSPSKSQSHIGINIPNFQYSMIIDPDFSILLDSNSISNDNGNSICKTGDGSSKLTTTQLVGIIVASGVIFIALVGIGLFVFIKKRKHTLLLLGVKDILMKRK